MATEDEKGENKDGKKFVNENLFNIENLKKICKIWTMSKLNDINLRMFLLNLILTSICVEINFLCHMMKIETI